MALSSAGFLGLKSPTAHACDLQTSFGGKEWSQDPGKSLSLVGHYFLMSPAGISITMLNRNGDSRYHSLVPDLSGEASNLPPLNIMLAVTFL